MDNYNNCCVLKTSPSPFLNKTKTPCQVLFRRLSLVLRHMLTQVYFFPSSAFGCSRADENIGSRNQVYPEFYPHPPRARAFWYRCPLPTPTAWLSHLGSCSLSANFESTGLRRSLDTGRTHRKLETKRLMREQKIHSRHKMREQKKWCWYLTRQNLHRGRGAAKNRR